MDDDEDKRMAALSRVILFGPALILLAWLPVGQWHVVGVVVVP
jgi:hypothetical protein